MSLGNTTTTNCIYKLNEVSKPTERTTFIKTTYKCNEY